MKRLVLFTAAAILVLTACTTTQPATPTNETEMVRGTSDLLLTDEDRSDLGITYNTNTTELRELRIPTNTTTTCKTQQTYAKNQTVEHGAHSICAYTIPALNNTDIVIQLQKFKDKTALNGSYQYDSSHLFSSDGLISRNELGDQSTFRVSTEDDYGGEHNNDTMHYYHLWITKDHYLLHITSSGTVNATTEITRVGERILSKFN
jgi:hypothetical protein